MRIFLTLMLLPLSALANEKCYPGYHFNDRFSSPDRNLFSVACTSDDGNSTYVHGYAKRLSENVCGIKEDWFSIDASGNFIKQNSALQNINRNYYTISSGNNTCPEYSRPEYIATINVSPNTFYRFAIYFQNPEKIRAVIADSSINGIGPHGTNEFLEKYAQSQLRIASMDFDDAKNSYTAVVPRNKSAAWWFEFKDSIEGIKVKLISAVIE